MNNKIVYVGVNVEDNGLFEGQYNTPDGMAYNSYLILDEKVCVMDSVDRKIGDAWIEKINSNLNGRDIDYLVISHVEPDHSYHIGKLVEIYPNITLVATAMAFKFLGQFYDFVKNANTLVVADGDTLSFGSHSLTFVTAPLVHWPEVMVSYESSTKTLFSADAFGKFGINGLGGSWECEARRYYFNIVGKFGDNVQALLKKLGGFEIKKICPLHGEILDENIGHYVDLYDTWSKYMPEVDGVFIAYSSVYGNTEMVAKRLYQMLKDSNVKVSISDLATSDMAENLEDAFKYSKLVLATTTYENSLFPVMEELIAHMVQKGMRNKIVGIIDNGTWAPQVTKIIKSKLSTLKNFDFIDNNIVITSAPNDDTWAALEVMKNQLIAAVPYKK